MLNFHDIEKTVEDIRDFSIIVEGKRDRIALEKLGFSNIFDISGKPLHQFVEGLPRDRKYVILTDFDKKGEFFKSKLNELMSVRGYKINNRLRMSVKNSFGIVKIEELRKISKIKEDVYYGKISTIDYKIFNRSGIFRRWISRKARRYWGSFWSD